jgi:hypothetical protein
LILQNHHSVVAHLPHEAEIWPIAAHKRRLCVDVNNPKGDKVPVCGESCIAFPFNNCRGSGGSSNSKELGELQMKVLKLALIGTAALAAASVTARADSLSDLKAQIEALNGRISQLEAAPAVPAGYQLMSVSKQDAIIVPSLDIDNSFKQTNVTTIGILPTADVPASTNIQWSGYARAALIWAKSSGSNGVADVKARGQLKVVGTTDTSVGEVGAQIQIRGEFHGHGDAGANFGDSNAGASLPSTAIGLFNNGTTFKMNEAWGWWKMTPELTLGGGYTGSLSGIGYGYDGACNCYYTDNADAGYGHGDTTQMRLSYASGPISAAIALEDDHNSEQNLGLKLAATDKVRSSLGVAAEVKYSGDMFSGEISGGVWGKHGHQFDVAGSNRGAWQIGAGFGMNLGDMAKLSVAAGAGKFHGAKFWKASALVSANLSDAVHGEVAFNYRKSGSSKQSAVLAGIYYDPVSQLTVGLEGEYIKNKGAGHSSQLDLVTVFRF